MKIIIYFIILLSIGSCSRGLNLTHKTYVCGDSIKVNSLHFINDSICYYEQNFLFDLEKPFKNTIIICRYKTRKKLIILNNLTKDHDSIGRPCFKIPDYELNKFSFFNKKLLSDNGVIRMGAPKTISNIEMFGFIDNITVDTLFYKKKKIYYQKMNKCASIIMYIEMPFIEK